MIMSDRDFSRFIEQHHFVPCIEHSIRETGMSSKVDAFSNGEILVRVVVDRGQKFIDLAKATGATWSDVFTLASKVDHAFQAKTGSFSEATKVLEKYWPALAGSLK